MSYVEYEPEFVGTRRPTPAPLGDIDHFLLVAAILMGPHAAGSYEATENLLWKRAHDLWQRRCKEVWTKEEDE